MFLDPRRDETWVQLGLHPHIASCYYVRNLGGIPRMFIEYADAGTLRDWLHDGKVKDWHTILDIAIQICYGLCAQREEGSSLYFCCFVGVGKAKRTG